MSRGKNAAGVNARLRESLQAANEARRRLESRLHDAEYERDQLRRRMEHIEAAEHPAIESERQRADAAARATADAVAAERARWQALVDAARGTVHRTLIALATHVPDHESATLEVDGLPALAELFGSDIGIATNRHGRRVIARGEGAVRKQMAFAAEVDRQGLL